jgi:polyhydroxyalkanoate synthesis regulator phasin
MQMSTKKKVAAIVITTVALTAGTVGVSSAASKSTTTRVSVTQASNNGIKGPRAEVAAVLTALVTKGTITQAQADAITAALTAAEVARPDKPLGADKQARLALISSTIGVDAATIKARLAAGETLAAIAAAKKDALITALVADETKRIDAAVTDGKLTAAQATTLKSTLTAHVTTEVNSVRPMGPKGGDKDDRGHSGPKNGGKGGAMGSQTLTLPAPAKA